MQTYAGQVQAIEADHRAVYPVAKGGGALSHPIKN
jgi:hypothetical protein